MLPRISCAHVCRICSPLQNLDGFQFIVCCCLPSDPGVPESAFVKPICEVHDWLFTIKHCVPGLEDISSAMCYLFALELENHGPKAPCMITNNCDWIVGFVM